MLDAEPKGFFRYRFLEGTFGGLIPPEEQEQARRTFSGAALIILCLFGLLFLRLWFLQLVQGENLRQRSEHNRIRQLDLPPWRGMILDRHGQLLVGNRPRVPASTRCASAPTLAGRTWPGWRPISPSCPG
jgi:hypothetical protein